MKRLLPVLLALVLSGCYDNCTGVNQTVYPTPVPPPTPVPTPTPTPVMSVCSTIAGVSVNAPAQLAVGAKAVIDATPRDAQGNKRDPLCDQQAGIQWTQTGPCSISPQIVFNPTLEATQPVGSPVGFCILTATVGGVEGTATVQIG